MTVRTKNYLFLISTVLLSACALNRSDKISKEVNYDELTFKNEKGYLNETLYTGLVVANYPNGTKRFESTFVEGIDNGQFREWDKEGNLIEKSNSKNGHLQGKYTRYYPSGQKYFETTYSKGNPNGEALEWHENGKLKIKYYYINGKENGLFTLWNDKGVKLLEGQMREGKRDGEWYQYFEQTNKVIINLYNNGELISSTPQ